MTVDAVIFDLDGVLLDSEHIWDEARQEVTEESGGRWRAEATRDMMGMSSKEWAGYMRDELRVPLATGEISDRVVARLQALYTEQLPLIPGADEAVRRLGREWPLGLASSSNRGLIDLALELAGLSDEFRVTVSSEEVERGKPSPDVYLETARRLGIDARHCYAVEDSGNGIRSGKAAGMLVVAIPERRKPPEPEVLATADLVLDSIRELTPEAIRGIDSA